MQFHLPDSLHSLSFSYLFWFGKDQSFVFSNKRHYLKYELSFRIKKRNKIFTDSDVVAQYS